MHELARSFNSQIATLSHFILFGELSYGDKTLMKNELIKDHMTSPAI